MSAKKATRDALDERVAAIDWAGVSGGQGKGFAQLFGKLRGRSAANAVAGISTLLGRTHPIAGLALPFLVERLPSCDARAPLLVLLAELATAGALREYRWPAGPWPRSMQRTRAAFATGESTYIAALGADDAAVRAAAAFALAWVPAPAPAPTIEPRSDTPSSTARAALREAFAREADPAVRASIVLAVGVMGEAPVVLDGAPIEQLASAIAHPGDPRSLALLAAPPPVPPTPWGSLSTLARARWLAAVFGDATITELTDAHKDALRGLLASPIDADTERFLAARGLPAPRALRRMLGIPREIPEGKHASVYDRWVTWLETGDGDAAAFARELAASIALEDAGDVIALMHTAEHDWATRGDYAGVDPPLPPGRLPKREKLGNLILLERAGSIYPLYRGRAREVGELFLRTLGEHGFVIRQQWEKGPDDIDDMYIAAEHPDGREITVRMVQGRDEDGVCVAMTEYQRTLAPAMIAAVLERGGAAALAASIDARATRRTDPTGFRVWLRLGWELPGEPPPACDELAFRLGKEFGYVQWPVREHLLKISEARREKLVLRLLSPENTNHTFGWVRFAPTPPVRAAAQAMVLRDTGWYAGDLESHERQMAKYDPFLDPGLRQPLEAALVAGQGNRVVIALLLEKLGATAALDAFVDDADVRLRTIARRVKNQV